MAEYIVNPRRAPRATARCRAVVGLASGTFETETEDIGARGCQVVSPRRVTRGEPIDVVITSARVLERLKAAGDAAWSSARRPWRVGVAFHEAYVPSAERWFEKLALATPGMGTWRRVPQRIALDAIVYLGAPPRFLVDFSAEEASLLRAIASGARLDELQARLRAEWPAAQRALFSLLARQAVTLSRGQSAHPDAWKNVLAEIEASLAAESLGTPPARPARTPVPAPTPTAAPLQAVAAPLPPPLQVRAKPPPLPASARPSHGANPVASPWGTHAPELELDLETPTGRTSPRPPRGAARANPGDGWDVPSARGSAGAGWRDAAAERGPEAQATYDRALAQLERGNLNGAIALLRTALRQAPGDAEIAATLGKLAFTDRLPSTR